MAFVKKNLQALEQFIPDACFDLVFPYLDKYAIKLKITPDRKSILGNYQYNTVMQSNTITVNGGLNKYSFLITLLHEIAHCVCFNTHKKNVAPHGIEWQIIFGEILQQFIHAQVFPDDIKTALSKKLFTQNASCTDIALEKILSLYDSNNSSLVFVDSLPLNSYFKNAKGLSFKIISKRRTRYLCTELKTGINYLFPAMCKVVPLNINNE
jgi:SprT protein